LPGNAPLVFAPAALAFLPAIADDGVPVAVGLVLIVGSDLEREGFVMFERGAAVEADTRDAGNTLQDVRIFETSIAVVKRDPSTVRV
jgi:hypothetical protein